MSLKVEGRESNMRIQELDGLRGIAVLAVIDCHYLAWLPASGSGYGWLGVDLFFVLSGFLITSILLQLRTQERYFRTFYARRALRILPPYLLGIIVYILISTALREPGSLKMWLSYIFYYVSFFRFQPAMLRGAERVPDTVCIGLAVLWSLSVEEVYYTIWAPVIRFTKEKGLICILVAMIVIAPALRWRLHSTDGVELFTFYCRMDGLAYGSAVALIVRYRQILPDAWKTVDRVCDRFAIALPFLAALSLRFGRYRDTGFTSSMGISFADLSFALLVYALIRRTGENQLWVSMFRAKWLGSVGKVSYSLYLFHYPLLILSEALVARLHLSLHLQVALQILLGLVLSFSVAYGLWHGMESRILRWKDKRVPSRAHPEVLRPTSLVIR